MTQESYRSKRNVADVPVLATAHTCTGCAACANICPTSAISIRLNADGFYNSLIEEELCIRCNKCAKVCPILQDGPEQEAPPAAPLAYSAWSLDAAVREQSSSGGMFTELARHILQSGGIVVGVALDEELHARHVLVRDEQSLASLRGAKYTQSFLDHKIFREIAQELKKKTPVLFTGTACQTAGLQSYLGRNDPNLILCDVICHGVPSIHLLDRYKSHREQMAGKKLEHIAFRHKERAGWQHSHVKLTYEGGSTQTVNPADDVYMQAFLNDLCLNETCHNCQFNDFPHCSDLTLGDFWGLEHLHPTWDLRQGASLVLVHTDKGKELLGQLKDRIFLSREPLDEALFDNVSFLRSWPEPRGRQAMLDELSGRLPLPELVPKRMDSLLPRYDVGIVGLWYSCNYGAILNGYATMAALNEMGYSAVLIDTAPLSGSRSKMLRYTDTLTVFRQFAKRWLHTTPPIAHPRDLERLNEMVDVFASGSDQVWNIGYNEGQQHIDDYSLLRFANPEKKRIAIASSFGHANDIRNPQQMRRAKGMLQCYDAVSVREDSGFDILQNQYGIQGRHILDPVFLCSRKKYDAISLLAPIQRTEQEYLVSYLLDPSEDKKAVLHGVQAARDWQQVHMLDAQFDFDSKKRQMNLPGIEENLTVEQFVHNIAHSRYVVTDSFHGACFAIIYRKDFICIANAERGAGRFLSLFKQLGLENRLVSSVDDVAAKQLLETSIDYQRVHATIARLRQESLDWLLHVLREPPLPHVRESKDRLAREVKKERSVFTLLYRVKRMSAVYQLAKSLWEVRRKIRQAEPAERHALGRREWVLKQQLKTFMPFFRKRQA